MTSALKYSFLILIILAGYVAYEWKHRPVVLIPLPYHVDQKVIERTAPIIIVGDRLSTHLGLFVKSLSETISRGLERPIPIQVIGASNEGLHRTLAKIKKLSRKPKMVIYIGGSQEWYENKYQISETEKINQNFSRYEDPWVQTFVRILPGISKFLYENTKKIILTNTIVAQSVDISPDILLTNNTLSYKLYRYELQDLLEYTSENNISFLGITQPINLEVMPRVNCPGSYISQGPGPKAVLQLLNSGDTKSAYTLANDIALTSPSYAYGHYLLGKVHFARGNYEDAFKSYSNAAAYDCSSWRGNSIYNVLLKSLVSAYRAKVFDFQSFVYDHWKEGNLFADDIYPQDLYWEQMSKLIGEKVRQELKL